MSVTSPRHERLAAPTRRHRALLALSAVLAIGAGACTDDDDAITVFTAASLADVLEVVAEEFRAETGIEVRLAVAGSSTLRLQLDEGADGDVFLPADPAQLDLLEAPVDGAPTPFASTSLVIAHRADAPPVGLDDFDDERLVLGACAPQVPCGGYARLAFDLAGIEPALDTEEPDVRSVATKVAEGELDAGLVYLTDVLADDRLAPVRLPTAIDAAISVDYVAAVLGDSSTLDDARRFVEHLAGPSAATTLARFGFERP